MRVAAVAAGHLDTDNRPLVAALGADGLRLDSEAAPDTVVEGAAGSVLLLVTGRASVEELGLSVSGDRAALDRWLAAVRSP